MTSDDFGKKTIVLAHGGGGELTKRLLEKRIFPKLKNPVLDSETDSAVLNIDSKKICFTTDSYVVTPVMFPGGCIGDLAVCGTVNDLAVMGAKPMAISLALIVEEGLDFEVLDQVIDAIAARVKEAGIIVATGDTKVIERRDGNGILINTSGIGELSGELRIEISSIEENDVLIINGNIAEHGLAVMAAREGLQFDTPIRTDVAPLNRLIQEVWEQVPDAVKFMRDPTRGGISGLLADLAESTGLGVEIVEKNIPLTSQTRHAAEFLGLDPLAVANEGKVVFVVKAGFADRVLEILKKNEYGQNSAVFGRFVKSERPLVEIVTRAGGRRMVQRPYGEELPRIC